MKRTIISAVILILIISAVTISIIINNNTSSDMLEGIDNAIEFCSKGNNSKALNEIDRIIENWDSASDILMVFSSHDKADEVDEALHIAKVYAENGENNMFIAECSRAKIMIKQINELEYPWLHNIL